MVSYLRPGQTTTDGITVDKSMFEAYTQLRQIAHDHQVEDKLKIPQLVIVGETSSGKSMLVQNFLRFPCSFSQANIATRCPVAYCLRYNPQLRNGEIRFLQPAGLSPKALGAHLQELMGQIQVSHRATGGFRLEPYIVEIEGNEYTDFEILDVPGLIGGSDNPEHRAAVEKITEHYVRNPNFMIVQLKEASQLKANNYGARRIQELCTLDPAPCGSPLPPRFDYRQHMVTIQTKFETFMQQNQNGTAVNQEIETLREEFGETYFVNMIFDGYTFADHSYEENVNYISELPELEKHQVNEWIITKLNRLANEDESRYHPFNQKYRSLIGINVVRKQIQDLWVRAFRSALPKLNESLHEQLDIAKSKYEAAFNKLQQQDPILVRSNYQKYITEFRSTIRSYVAYRSEIDSFFPLDLAGKTYRDIAERYDKWPRKQPITWRAHLTLDQLQASKGTQLSSLDLKLVGARHFERLRQVFSYMILAFKPREPTRDWIESVESSLHGGNTDYDNLEKAVRDILRTLVRETFLIGICWLTQMFSLLTELFAKDVKRYLLQDKFPYLRDHVKFLSAVDLEYHNTVRNLIRQAVVSIKHARNADSAYIVHDLAARMKNLAFSIPTEVTHKSFGQKIPNLMVKENGEYVEATMADVVKLVPPQKIMTLIMGSGSFLSAENRDQNTAEHHANGRKVIFEMYTAVCGQLLHSITTSFNANVVMKIQEYDTVEIERALNDRINRMSDSQIGQMANIQIGEIQQTLSSAEREINDLWKANDLIEIAIKEMEDGRVLADDERRQLMEKMEKARNANKLYAKVKHDEIKRKLDRERSKQKRVKRQSSSMYHRQTSASRTTDEEITDENELEYDEELFDDERELLALTDKTTADAFLLALYQKHDKEDLTYGFLQGDSLEADKKNPKSHDHLYVDENTLDYDNIKRTLTLKSTPARRIPPTRIPIENGHDGLTDGLSIDEELEFNEAIDPKLLTRRRQEQGDSVQVGGSRFYDSST
ncbi:unnamed protein product [Didymodactylos carnosus]|uniref:Dynamin N-terminal domain-containing protein n=1 Tax=Didymodactylos carnosus TaxID=1234261 RepID=A0A815PK16_9BILA|nr:unnamed protein product [Didymodactylos carnosus]CAF4323458.1 unnamed protein product [Didymodactylos carnosus]